MILPRGNQANVGVHRGSGKEVVGGWKGEHDTGIQSHCFPFRAAVFGFIQLQFVDFCCGLCYFSLYSLTAKREHRCEAGSCQWNLYQTQHNPGDYRCPGWATQHPTSILGGNWSDPSWINASCWGHLSITSIIFINYIYQLITTSIIIGAVIQRVAFLGSASG